MWVKIAQKKRRNNGRKGEKEIKIIIIKWEEQGEKVCKAWRKRERKDWRRENGKYRHVVWR